MEFSFYLTSRLSESAITKITLDSFYYVWVAKEVPKRSAVGKFRRVASEVTSFLLPGPWKSGGNAKKVQISVSRNSVVE
jgi:hypothetical protein